MIDYIKRLAGPYTTAGQTVFPFSFVVFEPSDIYVAVGEDSTEQPDNLTYGTDYTVSLNSDQDAAPGGSVTLTAGLAAGKVLVVGSAQPYNQTTQLTNYSRFPPEIINKALDRIVIEIQQILEKLGRTVTVPVTSSMTPEELLSNLLDVAAHAQEYADKAEKTYAAVLETKKEVDALAATQEAALEAKAEDLKTEIQAFTDEQEGRVERAADWALTEIGVSCQRAVWTVPAAIAAGTAIELPENMHYLVGHKQMQVYWNNLCLTYGQQWVELGSVMSLSETFQILMNLAAGDVLMVYMVPLGAKDYLNDLQALYNDLQATKEQLAYADIEDTTEIPMTYSTDITGAAPGESVPMSDAVTE